MPTENPLPVGKLPMEFFGELLRQAPRFDPRIIVGPGIGLDCAVIDLGQRLLVLKSDPITFTSDELSWYLIQVNQNDIATTGATPRWLLITFLLPEARVSRSDVTNLFKDLYRVCQENEISVIGGHTEITHGLTRPLAVGTLIGEIAQRDDLITPRGAKAGDRILITKGLAIEATALLAREFPDRLKGGMEAAEISRAQDFIFDPGIGILPESRAAILAGRVNAMHDPTEGGVAAALWELAQASNKTLVVNRDRMPILELTERVCAVFGISPLQAISSGALLMAVDRADVENIRRAIGLLGVTCEEIGFVEPGPPKVYEATGDERLLLERPERDAIALVFED